MSKCEAVCGDEEWERGRGGGRRGAIGIPVPLGLKCSADCKLFFFLQYQASDEFRFSVNTCLCLDAVGDLS